MLSIILNLELGKKTLSGCDCRPDPNQIVALFYDNSLNVKDEYYHAKELETLLKQLQEQ